MDEPYYVVIRFYGNIWSLMTDTSDNKKKETSPLRVDCLPATQQGRKNCDCGKVVLIAYNKLRIS